MITGGSMGELRKIPPSEFIYIPGGLYHPDTVPNLVNPDPIGAYRETSFDEQRRIIDEALSRYRQSDRQVRSRLIMAITISLILGFIGGHYWKGLVTKGNVTEVSKPKVGKAGEYAKGYRP